jgi:hypothetical protein
MSRITPDLLSDTLNLVALAREAALAKGRPAKAEALKPAEEGLRAAAQTAATPSAARLDDGLQALLTARQAAPVADQRDRLSLAQAMSAGGMADLDIARQLGATREEVQLWLTTKNRRLVA